MNITNVSACGLNKPQVLVIGRQLEDNYRQFVFDCSDFGVEVTSITLVHQRSQDVAPYLVDTSSTDSLTWTVTETDTSYAGYGKAELRISFTNGLAKSVVFTTMVLASITADTVIPSALQSWYDAMIDYIDEHSISPEELAQAIEDYLEEHPITAPVTSVNSKTGDVVITAADLGALTVELDPVFSASAAAGIESSDITAWNGKYTKPSGGVPVSDLNSTAQSRLMPTGGTTGQVLAKKSNSNYDTEWVNQSGGGGAVDSVNGKTGTVVLDADDVGALPDTTTASDLGAYVKPTGGIPKEDLASAVQTSLGKADTALQTAVTSFNGNTGAVTYTAPVTSVNGATGAVSLSIPTKTSQLQNDSGYITSAPVSSVDGKTGAVSVLPSGGSSGQVLSKASGTDYDVEWTTPQGGGGSDWSVLRDVTTTQEALVNIAVTDISVSEFLVCIECAPSANRTFYIPLNRTDGTHYDTQYGRPYIQTGTSTGAKKYGWVHIRHQVGSVLPVEKSGDAFEYAGGTTNMRSMAMVPTGTMPFNEKYTAVSVATIDPVPSGTRVIVLGK